MKTHTGEKSYMSIIKGEVDEDVSEVVKSDINNFSELKLELKEEPINSEKTCSDESNEPKIELKEEPID